MMIIKKNLFYLVILASIVFCICLKNNNNETSSQRCVEYGETCDIKDRLTCCNPNFICKLAVADSYFLCAREAQLGDYCEFDEDCGTVWHARCSSNNRCVCILNHIQKTKNNCVPLLGEYCLKNGECGTENSFCLNNQCRCEDNFYVYSKKQCLPKIINEKCQEDTNCRKVKFAKCSKNKVCICVMNTVALSPGLCYPLLNVACQVDKDCKVEHSICIENLCKCKPKYFPLSVGNCTPTYLGMPCEDDLDCRIFINNTKCSQGKVCICENYYYQTKDGFCELKHERSCLHDELCNDENSICVNDKCQCKPQFEVQGSKCIVIGINTCDTDADCDQMWFSVCSSDKKCICRDGYVEINRGTCVLQLEKICRINRQCRIPYSVCENGQCECEPKFLNIANKQCVLIESTVRSCHNHHHNCRLFTNSEYLKNGQHVCREYKVNINATACASWSGKFCTNSDQCGSKYSVCINNECHCKLKYVSHSDISCPTPFIGMPCRYDSYCKKFIKNARCLNKICNCSADYSKINGKCLPKLHISCLDKEPCAPKNSLCINEKCRCDIKYIQQGDECVLQSLNYFNDSSFLEDYKDYEDTKTLTLHVRSCESDRDCWRFRNSRCSSNKICICKEKSFGSNADYCYPVLDGFCRYDEQCGLNFDCVRFKCKCKPSFSPISVNQCVSTNQLYSCNDIIDCSDRWHSKCSKNKCVCSTNNIAINNSTCLPILDGYCWRDDQCQAVNSTCIDYRCQCKSTHVAVANNLCVLKKLTDT